MDGINAAVTSEIQIIIGDINDEQPLFYNCDGTDNCVNQNTFTGNIDEHSAVGLSVVGLNMMVEDKDSVSIVVYFHFCKCSDKKIACNL